MTISLSQLDLNITLHSDYHLGTGFGQARVLDDRLLKDEKGRPYLPGSTLKALIRDGFERLLALEPLHDVAVCGGKFDYGDQTYKLVGTGEGRQLRGLCGVKPIQIAGKPQPLDWFCPLCRVFGTPYSPASFSFSAAYLDYDWLDQLRSTTLSGPQDRVALRQVNPPHSFKASYNRIDRATGRAEDEKLFNFELGAAGLTFRAVINELSYPENELARRQNWLVLAAGSAYVEELGKRRRRGVGRCQMELAKPSLELKTSLAWPQTAPDWLDGLEELLSPAETTQSRQVVSNRATKTSSPGYANRYIVIAHTEEALLIARRAEAGNSLTALPYLNGTSLRGGLAAAWLHRAGVKQPAELETASRNLFEQIFGSEKIRFSNLFPAHLDGHAENGRLSVSLPAPRSVLTCKANPGSSLTATQDPNDPHGLSDAILLEHERSTLPEECPECGSALERFEGFLYVENETSKATEWERPHIIEQANQVLMHNEVDDRSGRAADGALFAYNTLQRDQWFAGTLEDLGNQGWLGQLLNELDIEATGGEYDLRLGRAAHRGQGKVHVRLIPAPFSATDESYFPTLLVGTPLAQRFDPDDEDELLILTLLSDCILQDHRLSYLDHIPASYLVEWLDLPKESLMDVDEQGKRLPRYRSTRLVEGWNVAHGLPRETEIAIEAGSVFTYRLSTTVPRDLALWQKALQRLEYTGLGQRRDEGFGRLVFNHPLHQELDQFDWDNPSPLGENHAAK